MKVIISLLACLFMSSLLLGQQTDEQKRLIAENENKLANIILPEVDFQEVRLADAIAFLRKQARELDQLTEDEGSKGVNFLLILNDNPKAAEILITLKLKNVPIGEAVRYCVTLADLKYKVEPYAVVIRSR